LQIFTFRIIPFSVYTVPFLFGECPFTNANRLSYRCPTQADFPKSFSDNHRSLIMERKFRGKEQSASYSNTSCSCRKPEDVGAPNSEYRIAITSVYARVLDETQLGQILGWTCTSFREHPSNDPCDFRSNVSGDRYNDIPEWREHRIENSIEKHYIIFTKLHTAAIALLRYEIRIIRLRNIMLSCFLSEKESKNKIIVFFKINFRGLCFILFSDYKIITIDEN